MTSDVKRPLALLVMGPTASGKSALAVDLARQLDGEIISVDSSLVYRDMDIGTAKPPAELRAEIPHHLVDILDPAQSFSAGRFRTESLALIDAISRRGRMPILAGGTMLYFHVLLRGLATLPCADPGIRARLGAQASQVGWPALHEQLLKVDPVAARRIHHNDAQRIQRALEVYQLTGRPLSSWWGQDQVDALPFRVLKVAVAPGTREELHRRIESRFQWMLEQGLVAEVRGLWRRGDLHPALPALRSVGYRQVWGYLGGQYDYAMMVEKAVIATRQLAKRQFTWLRRERDLLWLESDIPGALETVIAAVERKR